MKLSTSVIRFLGHTRRAGPALAMALLLPTAALALPPYLQPYPAIYFGYESTLLQLAQYRYLEQARSAAQPEPPPGTEYVRLPGRYVTAVCPDNHSRTYWQPGALVAVPRSSRARVPHYGANR